MESDNQLIGPQIQELTYPVLGIKSPPSHPPILGILCVKSTQGLIKLAPAGMGRPISRMMTRRATTIPAPAESPMKMIEVGRMGVWVLDGGFIR
jgi:hypothetical protein